MNFKGPFIDSNGNSIDGSGVSIAILDTGIDFDHPFFGPDDDNNNIADKIVAQYDFGGNVLGGNNDSNASDTDGHGTHVASIAASSDSAYPGVAPGANLIALKIFPDGNNPPGSLIDIREALDWVLENKDTYNIVAVNLSVGDGNNYNSAVTNPFVSNQFFELAQNNITVVSAAGNNGGSGVSYPAADPHSIAVSAVDNQGRIANFSQHHTQLTDVFAPGVNIRAARNNGGSVSLSGTSMAAPHVSGAIAIAQQLALQELNRKLTFDEVQELLQEGDDVTNRSEYTGKLLNITKLGDAILQMSPYDPTTHLTLMINGSSESQRVLSYGGEAQDVVSEMIINDKEQEVKLGKNTWKKIEIGDYQITQNTVLEFEFLSGQQGELHGIGFDNDNILNSSDASQFFQVYGTESRGEQIGNYTEGKVHYSINVGEFFTGTFDYLVFANDDDANENAESVFSNIKIYEHSEDFNNEQSEIILTIGGIENSYSIQSYATGVQDIHSEITLDETGTELKLENNTWQNIEIGDYLITENTVLEFEFQSSKEGEIHGIGFDNNNTLDGSESNQFFQLYGTQAWGNQSFDNYVPGAIQTYQINVGEFFTGTFDSLVFVNDDDAGVVSESIFSNIKIYEQQSGLVLTIGGIENSYSVQSYSTGVQDIHSEITLDETGTELKLDNNTWQNIEIGDYLITENTVLEFEFQSSKEGEIHGIGFDDNSIFDGSESHQFFQLYGTQEWGNQSFDNYVPGAIQTYKINVGEFFTGTFGYLFFANDDDHAAGSESVFSNIKLYEDTDTVAQNEAIDPLIGNQSLDVFTLEDVASGVSNDHQIDNELLISQSDVNKNMINLEENIQDDFLWFGADNSLSETTGLSEVNHNYDLSSIITDGSKDNVDRSTLLS
ncbi:MAG: S8 family serine peptidase [Crocosphaera sp.]|nr:S8 family serine peptidase [Crocosphaera sp.]